jgi:cytochrome c553
MNLLRDQSAALRARSPLAYLSGMWLRHNLKVSLRRNSWLSRVSLRGALQLDLLVTVPVRITIFLAALLCLSNIAAATEIAPKLDIGRGGHCVEDPKFMRLNHMKLMVHQRDETVHQGMRGGKYSLAECVNCHASTKNESVLGSNENFCQGCHAYAAVKIDCFECHSSKRRTVASNDASHNDSYSHAKPKAKKAHATGKATR